MNHTLAEVGLKIILKDKLKIEGQHFNVDEILDLISKGIEGELVNIEKLENGMEIKVKICIE